MQTTDATSASSPRHDRATAQPWSISPIASEGMYANDGGLAIMNADKRVGVIDCQASYKRGMGYLAKCEERDANAALIVKCVNSHEALVSALADAVLQIEYLHEKFQETGTGNAVLFRARAALAGAK